MSDSTGTLKATLRSDLTAAMKAKDPLRVQTLRMVLAAVQTEEVAGKEARELSDEDVLKVLAKESKKRGEAAEIYTENGRGELADQLGERPGMKQMGQVMKAATALAAGKADGSRLSKAVRDRL